MKYPVAERFKAPQGEGLFTGTPFAFIRLVGCSVGHRICTFCDTNFDKIYPRLGGGLYTAEELAEWAGDYHHSCISGGEPLGRDLTALIEALGDTYIHIETSGTVNPPWLDGLLDQPWISVSPKPGYLPEMIRRADEVKVILGGLGYGPGWPTVEDAVAWATDGKLVYVQPRNSVLNIDKHAMDEAIRVVMEHPSLRLSIQAHKYLRVR